MGILRTFRMALLVGLWVVLATAPWVLAEGERSPIVISSAGRVSLKNVSKEGVTYVSSSGKTVTKPWPVLGRVRCGDLRIGYKAEEAFARGEFSKAGELYPKAIAELDAHLKALRDKYSALSASGKNDEALSFFSTQITCQKNNYDSYRAILNHRMAVIQAKLSAGITRRERKHDGMVQCEVCRGKKTVPCPACKSTGRIPCPTCRHHYDSIKTKEWKKKYDQPKPDAPVYCVICPKCRGTNRVITGYDRRHRPIYGRCPRCKGVKVSVGKLRDLRTVVWACPTCSHGTAQGTTACPDCTKGKRECPHCGGEGWYKPGSIKTEPEPQPQPSRRRRPRRKRNKDNPDKVKPQDGDLWGDENDEKKETDPAEVKPKPDDDSLGGF